MEVEKWYTNKAAKRERVGAKKLKKVLEKVLTSEEVCGIIGRTQPRGLRRRSLKIEQQDER